MSALWEEVAEVIDVGGLFPGILSMPICALCAIENIEDTNNPYEWRNFNQAKRKLQHCKPSSTLTKSVVVGSDLPFNGRKRIGDKGSAIIGSFPDLFCFSGDWKNAVSCIANSVPPLLMKAIATQIRHKLWQGDPLTRYQKTMTYPEILGAAWLDHLAPRDPNAPTVISTFAGGGGSSLGYSMAGYRELLAVEWDDNAVATFKLNFPDVPVYHGDIAKLSVEECMELAGLMGSGEIDLLDGSPPCQGMSTAGKRNLDDPRNQLFREFVRLLRSLKPKVFVMENVPGLVKGKMKLIFAEIMRELKASDYQVRCKKLNAMYFYVPQSRERLIFIGIRNV